MNGLFRVLVRRNQELATSEISTRQIEVLGLFEHIKFWFPTIWGFGTAFLWFANGHQISEFLVLIPYALISCIPAAAFVLRFYVMGYFDEDDDLKKD